MILFYFHY